MRFLQRHSRLVPDPLSFCPPPVLADLPAPLSLGPRIPWAHALLMAVHEVVGTQHAPARARLRLAAVLVARTTSCWSVRTMERSG